jgi:hypothetical protein
MLNILDCCLIALHGHQQCYLLRVKGHLFSRCSAMQRNHIQAKKWAANGNKEDSTACQTYWTLVLMLYMVTNNFTCYASQDHLFSRCSAMQRNHIQAKKWAANGNKEDSTACQTYWTLVLMLNMVTNSVTCYASKDICFLDAVRCNIITFKLRNGQQMATRMMQLHAKHTRLLLDRFTWSPTVLLVTRHRTNCFLDAVRCIIVTFKLRNRLQMATRMMPLHARHT